MRNIKFIYSLLIASSVLLTSCFDDETIEDQIQGTPNLLGFASTSAAVSAVSDGQEYEKSVNVRMVGPRLDDVSGTVTATVSVDESSTAIEGTHYRLDNTTFSIGPDDNFLGTFSLTMLTAGIQAPLPANPQLVLNIQSVSGDGSVIANGNSITINMLYLCFADLSGTYTVTNDFCNPTFTATISSNPDGSWYASSADGGFLHQCTSNTTLLNYGSFNEVCGEIQPSTDLQYGSLGIGSILSGTWDQATGTLIMQHEDVFFPGGPYAWESTYVRQ